MMIAGYCRWWGEGIISRNGSDNQPLVGPGRASFVLRPVIYLVQIGPRYTGRFNGQTMSQPGIKQNKNDTSIRRAFGGTLCFFFLSFHIRVCTYCPVVNILALDVREGEFLMKTTNCSFFLHRISDVNGRLFLCICVNTDNKLAISPSRNLVSYVCTTFNGYF